MTPFFRAENLTVGYRNIPLIRDIAFGLERGQVLTLIGPNGSGKSTILKSLTRHLKHLGGTVYLDGQATDGMSGAALARQLAVVFPQRPQEERMTCRDVVAAGRYPYTGLLGILSGQDHEQVRRAMELVDVWGLGETLFDQLSDGQRQRVLLARAICQQPQVIVLDEPTSFLDVRYQLELLQLLGRMAREEQIAIILSLHELDLAQKISDLVLCVKGDTITRMGPPGEIFRREVIEDLYDLPPGSYHPLFGSFELAPPGGAPQVFVIAGGGTGIPVYRELQQKRIPFATGILLEHDVDYQLAKSLAGQVYWEAAFEPIGEETYQKALAGMTACGQVWNCLTSYGTLNQRNRALLQAAQERGLTILT